MNWQNMKETNPVPPTALGEFQTIPGRGKSVLLVPHPEFIFATSVFHSTGRLKSCLSPFITNTSSTWTELCSYYLSSHFWQCIFLSLSSFLEQGRKSIFIFKAAPSKGEKVRQIPMSGMQRLSWRDRTRFDHFLSKWNVWTLQGTKTYICWLPSRLFPRWINIFLGGVE